MIVHLGDECYWEVTPEKDTTVNKAILRSSRTLNGRESMTISMDGFEDWLWDNLEEVHTLTKYQQRIIFVMQKWGQNNYRIDREGKIIFS